MKTRNCLECSAPYEPARVLQKYCQLRCEVRAKSRRRSAVAKEQRHAANLLRTCADCAVSIADRRAGARRCLPCSKANDRKTNTARMTRARSKGDTSTSGARTPSSSLQRRDAPKLSAPKQPKVSQLPNFDGDWYPGWTGPYSNHLSPLAIELLKSEVARPVVNPINQTMRSADGDRVVKRTNEEAA